MPIGMTEAQVRELALAVGNLCRAAAVWGMDKAAGGPADQTEPMVHYFVREVLRAGMARDPTQGEIDMVWEL